jgi:Zn-dependent M28 family amino/carboxypeptidase
VSGFPRAVPKPCRAGAGTTTIRALPGHAASDEAQAAERQLREVIETLAPIERGAGSAGELRAARWLAERLRGAGCQVQIDEERYLDGYAAVIGSLAAAGAVSGLAALGRRTRRLGAAGAVLVAAAIADDISNGPRLYRRARSAPETTWNVVARSGDPEAARTLVVLAHHDAARTGAIFDDRAQRWLGERFPGVLERIDTSLPLWWGVLAAPMLVAAGATHNRRGVTAAGIAASLLATAVFADVARSPICPGANDNLSAVAVLVALAERLAAEPIHGLRVLLVSCGAEEVIQGGIYGFADRYLGELPRERTWFLNLETVGSPRLVLLEGEGPVLMEDYHDRSFRDLVALVADRAGAPVRRGMRARNSTDAVIPSRRGYPTTTLTSIDRYKSLSNYHQMSDTPENVDLRTVRHALTVTEAVARELAANPWIGH